MHRGNNFKIRVRVLVKAFPQPSKKHEETVCCAGVDEETGQLVRLFPIRYRRLPPEARFDRYDQVEMTVSHANDGRPDSYRVDEDSIFLLERATTSNLSAKRRTELWTPFISESLAALEASQKQFGTSLGIIQPENVDFYHEPLAEAEQEVQRVIHAQHLMFEEPLKPIETPKYRFYYRFTSGGRELMRTIMDWEVQAAYVKFRSRYPSEDIALKMLHDQYANRIPKQNLHFVMGTMAKRKYQFILIGLLRSSWSPEMLSRQIDMFD